MENQLYILDLFNENGILNILEKFEDLINKHDMFINFIILNIKNNKNNIKILSNFIKLDIYKYKNLIHNIISSDLLKINIKKIFLNNLFTNNINNNILIFNDIIYNIIFDDLKINTPINTILYNIFNNNIIEQSNSNLQFFYDLFNNIIEKNSSLFIKWLFDLLNIYNYRCKSFFENEYNDNILYILLNSIFYYFKNEISFQEDIFNDIINNKIDIINIKYNDIIDNNNNYIYFILIYKFINITIFLTIEDIEYYIDKKTTYLDKIDKLNNTNMLYNFEHIKNFIIKKNKTDIEKCNNIINKSHIKLNNFIMEHIYLFYKNIFNYIILNDNKIFENK